MKAAREVGYDGKFYTSFSNALDAPAGIGNAGLGRVLAVADWLPNVQTPESVAFYRAFWQRFPKPANDHVHMRMQVMMEALAKAIEQASSVEAMPVALKLEQVNVCLEGRGGRMRPSDHQFQQLQNAAVWTLIAGARAPATNESMNL